MTVCGWGCGGPSPGPVQCRERPLPGKFMCPTHTAEAMARLETLPEWKRRKPERWTAAYLVSGSSRD